jgi:hypothetical protein
MKELYERFLNIRNESTETKIKILVDIMKTFPNVINTIINRVESCFGKHRVYVVHFSIKGEEFIKVGYTKNTVPQRLGEIRWEKEKATIVEIIREKEYQAKGAYDFELVLKHLVKDYKKEHNLTLPGKGELLNVKYKNEITEIYDSICNDYVDVVGLKRTN